MPIVDVLDSQTTKTEGRTQGQGAVPNALLARLRDLGLNRAWVVTAQDQGDAVFVQWCFYNVPTPPA